MRKLFLLSCLLLAVGCASSQTVPGAGSDSLHQVKRVKVAEGVELEVLDFGGQGPALVFLAGLGNTGHVFDGLAPEFTTNHHVYAFTRRGFGASSWPDTGYDTATLGQDVVHALDGLGIGKASLAGHSMAGDEMTWVGSHHPERIDKLVFLDATDDRAEISEFLRSFSNPPMPTVSLEGLPSRDAVAAALERDLGGPVPDHEIDQGHEFDPTTGRYLRPHRRPDAVEQMLRGVAKPDFSALRAPVLSLFDGEGFPQWLEFVAGLESTPADFREQARAFLPVLRQHTAEADAALRKLPGWKLVKLENARHYIWLTNRADVVREMCAFLAP
ncbi:alpha/beta hydrolase [Archangium violaceum]|uniref:alpha/beta fold hydrolase n=1 Tax=Archangium violaceum TaxID=83451 RepID=UPI0019510659|nr:alpha/beta hydrolase [Archangium violaceum]QRN99943.1 alpha/beta hydrolase [Archangium violaceum]